MQKKILVTGGTGFIGSRLVRKLVSGNHQVFALVRKSSSLAPFSGFLDQLRLVEGDVTDPASLDKALSGIDEVYHCAGYTYMGGDRNRDALLYAVNVEGTRHLLRAASRAGVRRVVHMSSITAVGMSGGRTPVDESCEWNFQDLGLTYAETKHKAEIEVHKAVAEGLDCVIINPAFVFGAGDVNFNAGGIIRDVYRRRMPIYPLGGICVVDVEIVVDTAIRAMEAGRTGERYLIGGDNVTYRELADTISRVTGAPRVRVPLPFFLAKPLLSLLKIVDSRKQVSRLFNLSMFRVASEFLYFDASKAERELGMNREPHEFSIRRAFEWYRREGLL
ncbi:SDR family oxidoreductase [Prosthecochloris sp. N3]|uniref:SDR family oxidoreductase n=1 Tax=Prosthecochloris ethylica TaxID=2743976 RepID=A0ABR9XPK3_9CHLB|nr:SDR family oxidoreductase [Prosthecochloris sp. ZM_2]MBF0586209.1 SDR family oxidoreductase [Prosthecochloris ethylica]MBF0635915.1 SDR family oxidoreductase [Prosthecochloris ethylica]NUK47410.1 SDR family oxidoreductase [Prosthecochloris ethylica]RNA64960.1 NAD-dependent epimerase/dehydratase family protein [Prosthecochloris sp. ZM_2]